MEQKKESLLAAFPPLAKRPRLRRLQKSVSKHRSNVAWRFGSGALSETPSPNKSDTRNIKPQAQAQDHRPSDSKWAESPGEDRFVDAQELAARSWAHLGGVAPIVPELSHLATAKPPQPPSTLDPDAPAPSTPRMRRRAKTPIFSIGQLEEIPRPSNALARTTSVDLIAEQYRALLDYRAPNYAESCSGSSRASLEGDEGAHGDDDDDDDEKEDEDEEQELVMMRRQRGTDSVPDETILFAPKNLVDIAQCSPTSDDGTLVSFEEETVYFKPVSFSPEPRSPVPQPPASPSYYPTPDDNLSLQICLDLLTRELSSALLAGQPGRSCTGTSALQVWVMIEAYERLRDQILERSHGSEESRSLAAMFDMWLRALYSLHDSLNGNDAMSESDYGTRPGAEELD